MHTRSLTLHTRAYIGIPGEAQHLAVEVLRIGRWHVEVDVLQTHHVLCILRGGELTRWCASECTWGASKCASGRRTYVHVLLLFLNRELRAFHCGS